MNAKKWLIRFACTALALVMLFAGFNILTDPMGVFGDPLFDWYSYNMTNNPRAAKIAYLDEHHGEYDSYIIGCSSTSSFPVDAFNEYTGASFYNMIMYGADMLDVEQISAYLIEHYTVKNLVVNVFLLNGAIYDQESDNILSNQHAKTNGENPLTFYSRYLFLDPRYGAAKITSKIKDTYLNQTFDVFNVKTGTYDKRKRDAEPIGSTEAYLEAYPGFDDYPVYTIQMNKIDETMASVARIKAMCEENGVNLTVVSAPVYIDHFKCFVPEQVEYFFTELAKVTDFWDFTLSSASCEMRYFYDETHFRNNLGYMAAGRIFGDDDMYIPDDFGAYVTSDNVGEHVASFASVTNDTSKYTIRLPVLMYHHLADEGDSSVTVSTEAFERQLSLIREWGYVPITLEELYNYVTLGAALPEYPVLITFDDGYTSNYELAYPLLMKYNTPAAIFVIGVSVGKDSYKDTDHAMNPHFGWGEAAEMVESGLITIGSHTYDMHQWAPFEEGKDAVRENILRLEDEDEDSYIEFLRADITRSMDEIESALGETPLALAYPGGAWDELAQAMLNELGVKMTFSTEVGMNTVIKGLPQSLYALKRYNINGDTTDEALKSYLDGSFTQ